jgi:hypothetical protein
MMFLFGLFVGAILGVFGAALMCAAGRADERIEEIIRQEEKE